MSSSSDDDNDDPELRRSISPACRTRHSTPSPNSSFGSSPVVRFSFGSASALSISTASSVSSFNGWMGYVFQPRRISRKRKPWHRRRTVVGLVLLVAFFLVVNSWMLYRIQDSGRVNGMQVKFLKMNSSTVSIRVFLQSLS